MFCDQTRQTGVGETSLADAYEALRRGMQDADPASAWDELAFYGGSFTALPQEWIERFLDLAAAWKQQGRIGRVRCSTRPDVVDAAGLARWKALGLDVVELGVQSFQDAALQACARGYDAACAVRACSMVRAAGLGLGVQLMPGLPGRRPGDVERDVAEALVHAPEGLRLYPCLVIEGTALARQWRQGKFVPMPLEAAAWAMGRAILRCWEQGVPLWRIGVLEQPGFAPHVLAGPHHPAAGTMARSRAIFLWLRRILHQYGPPARVLLPRRVGGELWGIGGELLPRYARLGMHRGLLRWHDQGWMEWQT
ncbi:radical SAM protein [Megalodesulfovibrio paquesii]